MHHPGVGVLGKNWIGSLEATDASRGESKPRVIVRVAEDEDQFDSRFLKVSEAISDKSTTDPLTVPITSDRQWGKDLSRDFAA